MARSTSSVQMIRAAVVCLGVFAGGGVAYAAQDVVIMTNGDKLVGEIKKVEKDVLTFETDYSDVDFKIKWEKIASIESDSILRGRNVRWQAPVGLVEARPGEEGNRAGRRRQRQLPQLSAAQPIERTFWSRFESGLDFGYSLTRTNSAKQLSLGTNLAYRDENHVDQLFANVFSSTQENAPDTQRWDVGNDFRRLLGSRWYVNTTQDFLNSEEQGLDLRTTIGGGGGRYLLRTSSQHLALGGGLAWTKENYTDATVPTKDSADAYIATEFMTEKLKITDLITRLTYYPSLTISDRYRLSYRFDLDFNLPGDWYLRIGLFDNYDNTPPSGFSKNDYGWSNAFGFKF